MGNEIGYVSNVKVINSDEIFVSFVITKSDINLPAGTLANIESTGLVGSRSLELYPPNLSTKESDDLIIPKNPVRVQGVFSDSTRVAEIIYSASSNLNKSLETQKIPYIRDFIHNEYEKLSEFCHQIDEINEYQNNAIENITNNAKIKEFNKTMENLNNEF